MRRLFILLAVCLTACTPAAVPTLTPTVPPPTATQPPSTATTPPPTATASPVPPTDTPAPTPTETAVPGFFTHVGEIVPHGAGSDWDSRYTDPGAVVYANGAFHILRNGFKGWPASVQIGYVTSTDGLTWTEPSADPVLHTDDVPYAGVAALASSVLVEPDGTWVLYFYTWETSGSNPPSRIGRATAPEPSGPWTVDPEPVLVPGRAGAWDSQQVLAPDVFHAADGSYVMYFSGVSGSGRQAIGRATSPDGVVWTKYDDPATTDAPGAESDPVFTRSANGEWDAGWVHQPRVFQIEDGTWVMVYRGVAGGNPSDMALGYATSADGLTWVRAAANPILKATDVPSAQYFWFTNALYHDGTLYLFWEVDRSQKTSIFLATHTGGF